MYGKIGSGDSAGGGVSGGDDEMSFYLRHLLSSSSSSSSSSVILSLDRGKEAVPYRAGGGWELSGKLDRELAPAPSLAVPPMAGPDRPDASGQAAHRARPELGEADDYEWESEEGAEPSEERAAKPAPTRTGPKRSRAAEVHNLSEKRRRSRINEKMKALQNLIPNSNKTDKASMLDEAIEYLKQLQLQVQMLSMRNGMSLHPMYMPGTMQSLQVPNVGSGFGAGDCPIQLNNLGLGILPVGEESAGQTTLSLPNQPPLLHQPLSLPSAIDMRKSTGILGLDVSLTHRALFQLPTSATELNRKESLPRQPHIDVHPASKLPDGHSSLADQKTNCLEEHMLQQSNVQLLGPTDSAHSEILIQQLDRQEETCPIMGPR